MWHDIEIVANWAAVGVAMFAFAGWLPPVAAGLSIVWLGMQITSWIVNKGWVRK